MARGRIRCSKEGRYDDDEDDEARRWRRRKHIVDAVALKTIQNIKRKLNININYNCNTTFKSNKQKIKLTHCNLKFLLDEAARVLEKFNETASTVTKIIMLAVVRSTCVVFIVASGSSSSSQPASQHCRIHQHREPSMKTHRDLVMWWSIHLWMDGEQNLGAAT